MNRLQANGQLEHIASRPPGITNQAQQMYTAAKNLGENRLSIPLSYMNPSSNATTSSGGAVVNQ